MSTPSGGGCSARASRRAGRPRSSSGIPSPWYASPKEARRADRLEQFAIAAATEALDQAGELGIDPSRIGTIFATGVGGLHTLEEQVRTCVERGERRVSPFLVPMMMPNASGAAISMRWGLQGPNETICTACAAGTHAIGNAARLIAWGRCDAVVTGGSESAGTITSMAGFGNMTALTSTGISRPFDVDRDGFVMGEGVGRARARGVGARRRPRGDRSSARCSARRATPTPTTSRRRHRAASGAQACMRLALDDAGLQPGDIRQINAHGTSTPLNDAAEAEAVLAVFGPDGPPVTSNKGVLGHALGAAGALEAAAVLLSFRHRQIPPTANTKESDLGIDVVTGEPRDWEPGPTISNNFGFGGHNGSVILAPA